LKNLPTKEKEFEPHPDFTSISKEEWYSLDEERFRELFRKGL